VQVPAADASRRHGRLATTILAVLASPRGRGFARRTAPSGGPVPRQRVSTGAALQCEGDGTSGPPTSRDARLLLAGIATDAFGTGLTLPFLVVYLHAVRGLPLGRVGLIAAVPAALALFLLGRVGVLVARLGPRRVMMAALAAAASGALLLSRAETAPAAFLARTLTGIAAAAFWPAHDALIASVVPSEHRQRYFGVSFAFVNAGIGVGGVVGAIFVDVAHPSTFVAVYRADALTFLVPLALLAVPLRHVGGPVADPHSTAVRAGGTYGDVLRDRGFRRLLLLGFVSSFVGYGPGAGGWAAD